MEVLSLKSEHVGDAQRIITGARDIDMVSAEQHVVEMVMTGGVGGHDVVRPGEGNDRAREASAFAESRIWPSECPAEMSPRW